MPILNINNYLKEPLVGSYDTHEKGRGGSFYAGTTRRPHYVRITI